jgi:CBS domain-containing protein
VEDAMTEDVITIDADASVKKAVDTMNKNEIGCLIVTRNAKAIGIVTERDMLTRVSECRETRKEQRCLK